MPADTRKQGEKHFKKIRSLLKEEKSLTTEANMHALRAEIKKLRSLIKVVQYGEKKKLHKEEETIKEIFSAAGKIRGLQLLVTNLRSSRLMRSEGYKSTVNNLAEEEKQFRKKSGDYRYKIKSIRKKTIHGIDFDRKELDSCLNDMIKEMNGLLVKPSAISQWHEIRKKLKFFLHASKWKVFPKSLSQRSTISFLKKTEQQLGEWHNDAMQLEELRRLSRKYRGEKYDRTKNKLAAQKKKKEMQILPLLKKTGKIFTEKPLQES